MPTAIRKSFAPVLSLAGLLAIGSAFIGCQEDDSSGSNALIELTSPKGGETFKVGQTVQVKWTTPRVDPTYPVEEVDIRFSWDNGVHWMTLNGASITKSDAAWGNFPWTIPATVSYSGLAVDLVGKTQCLLRAEQYSAGDSSQRSTMASTFSITAATP